jgi:uncharacterized metal-binding protein YceD (DUF177 family)
MTDDAPMPGLMFRTAALATRKPTRFAYRPDAEGRAALAGVLGLPELPALTLTGEIAPEGRRDFRLTARLEAQAVQACVVTLAPVPATVSETVTRRYLADYTDPDEDEAEMPQDDSEPLPEVIDIAAIAAEALALALPPFPRAPSAELGEAVFGPPGVEPLRQADLNPFAGLAGLAERMKEQKE